MQLNLNIGGFDPRKLEAGCDGLRVGIFAKIHSWLEDLVLGLVGIVPGEILAGILLGESTFEAFERIWVSEVVWVVRFARWVVGHGG